MKKLTLLLVLLLWACSKDSPQPEGNENPSTPTPENPDSGGQDPPPSDPAETYPYEVVFLNLAAGQETEYVYNINGEADQSTNINADLQLGSNGIPGFLQVFGPEYRFLSTRVPTRLSIRNSDTGSSRVIAPICTEDPIYDGKTRAVSREYIAHILLGENNQARVDVFSLATETCATFTFPEYSQFYKVYLTGNVLVVDNGQDPGAGRTLYFVDLITQATYQTLIPEAGYQALTARDNQVYLFYRTQNGEFQYEIRDLTSLEVTTARTPTTFIPVVKPFFQPQWDGDRMLYEVPAAGPGAFAKLPEVYSFSDHTKKTVDATALYNRFQEDYFQEKGTLPYGLDFTDYAIDLPTGQMVVGFTYTDDSCGCTNFKGGILFTSLATTDYQVYYTPVVPDAILPRF